MRPAGSGSAAGARQPTSTPSQGLPAGTLLVVYDVTADWRRRLVAERLRPMADWIQGSAWLVAPRQRLGGGRVFNRLRDALARSDRLRVYGPCADCLRGSRWVPAHPRPLAWFDGYVLTTTTTTAADGAGEPGRAAPPSGRFDIP